MIFLSFYGSPVCVASHTRSQKCDSFSGYFLINQRVRKAAASSSHLSFYLRNYSTSLSPVKTYINPNVHKLQILKENKGKSGVYRWVNLVNGKSYVGSSVNLGRRMRSYFSILNLNAEIRRSKSIIYRSLVKYGYSNFSLEILEYCEPSAVVLREQHYFDLLKPDYNILKIAASSFGLRHSKETKAKISRKLTGRTLTQEHIAKI